MKKPFDVFISVKSSDFSIAKQIYEFLTRNGISVFFSDESLRQLGESDYAKAIDDAIEEIKHMIVVTSSADNAKAKWVQYEWRNFVMEKNSGRKNGNLITIITEGLTVDQLPLALRGGAVIKFDEPGIRTLLSFVRDKKNESDILRGINANLFHKSSNLNEKHLEPETAKIPLMSGIKQYLPQKKGILFTAVICLTLLTVTSFSYIFFFNSQLTDKLSEFLKIPLANQNSSIKKTSLSTEKFATSDPLLSDYQDKDALDKKKRDAEVNRAIQEALNEKKLAEEQAAKASQGKKVIEEKLAAAEAKQKADTEKAAKRTASDRAQNLDKSQEQRTNDTQSQQLSSQQSAPPPSQLKIASTSKQGAAIYINSPGNNDLYIEKLANQVRKELRVNGREAMSLSAARYSVRWANARIGKEGPDGMGEFTFSIKLNGEIIDTNTGQVIKSIPEEETEKGRDQNATYILDSLIKTVSKRLAQQLTLP